jgi:hypothetical protein
VITSFDGNRLQSTEPEAQRPRGEERSMAVGLDVLGVMAYL